MELVYVGKIVNTHGIKGELKILSDIDNKDKIFKVGNEFMIDDNVYIIKSYRHHKCFEMVTLNDFTNINEVLYLVGKKVFIDRKQIDNKIIYNDYINLNVYINDELIGVVEDYNNGLNPLLIIKNDNKTFYIPINGNFIESVDLENKKLYVTEDVRGLM